MENAKYSLPAGIELTIQDILNSTIEKDEAESQSYIVTAANEKITRVNVVGMTLYKEKIGSVSNFLLDDGSGKMVLRFFEENRIAASLEIGDCVRIIGRVREFNKEKYLAPDIVKKTDPLWLKVRRLKMGKREISPAPSIESKKQERPGRAEEEEITEMTGGNQPIASELFPQEKICQLIRDLDRGSGVAIEEILEKSSIQKTEDILQKMLERGEIFQILPGKVKVL